MISLFTRLAGYFSRVDYQLQNLKEGPSRDVVQDLTLRLPPGVRDVYYYDLIGNVSTSKLRPAPFVPKGVQAKKFSSLELRPRYPIMGGWNYSFTLGWDSALENSAGWDASAEKYIVAVPIMTLIPGSVIDEAEIKIILPEGTMQVNYNICGMYSLIFIR